MIRKFERFDFHVEIKNKKDNPYISREKGKREVDLGIERCKSRHIDLIYIKI